MPQKKRSIEQEEQIIAECHSAEVENGVSEADASESDAFARRVLGLPEPEDKELEDHNGPTFRKGRCTRCKRTKHYCEC